MLNLLDSKTRSQVQQSIRRQVEAGGLDAATSAVEDLVQQSGDNELMQAALTSARAADLDWIGVLAEAIEADVLLRSLGEIGCRQVALELGNTAFYRHHVIRHYYGPPPMAEGNNARQATGRHGGYHGLLDVPLLATGLEQLAAIQLRPYPHVVAEQQPHQRSAMLAGHLLVLRFFGAVKRRAQAFGFPFPVQLKVDVQSISGEDAISQLDPRLDTELACAVLPISKEVEIRLATHHRNHVAEWNERTTKLIGDLYMQFESNGYAPSRMLPDELGETKERLQRLERTLTLFEPGNRMTWPEFEALAVRVREVRDRTAPAPIDPGPYR